MADFDFSSWRQQATADPPPPPIIDPEQARENAIADNTRTEEAANDFLVAKQRTLFGGPDPYFAKQGKDAFLAAPATIDGLRQSRNRLVDGMANDAQRRRLAPMLDAQIGLARDDIARHAA